MLDAWIPLRTAQHEHRPHVGARVLMYLTKYRGADRYRAGVYLGPDDWALAANTGSRFETVRDRDVSHWQLLPEPPEERAYATTGELRRSASVPPSRGFADPR